MIYAPVIIATLNRYEHFKRCVESLENNSWARYTEVYISVDYPPEKKYEEGRRAIIGFLKNREFNFKKVHLYIQEENLGVVENYQFLRDLAFERFDRVITFEDDLEVSPNYLEFMDKALEAGQDDDKVYCVTGYSGRINFPKKMTGTAFKAVSYSYGFGTYRDKRNKMLEELSVQWIDEIANNSKKMLKIFSKSKVVFYYFLTKYIINHDEVFFCEDGTLRTMDIVVGIYMIMNDMQAILPRVSKVKNWGMDGTGQNSGVREDMRPQIQKFDIEQEFEFKLENNKRINRIIEKRWSRIYKVCGVSKWVIWKSLAYYFYLRIARKQRMF